MRSFLAATVTLLIAGVACGQFKVNQTTTSTAGVQTTTVGTPESLDDAKRIPRDAAIKMVKDGTAVWIDVRPVADYNAGHIHGAINIPLTDLPLRFKDLPVKKYLITYCA
jgi:3-mercaptopyruvate sulfurtransferase SseA